MYFFSDCRHYKHKRNNVKELAKDQKREEKRVWVTGQNYGLLLNTAAVIFNLICVFSFCK